MAQNNYQLLIVGEGYLIIVDDIEYLVDKDGNVANGNNVDSVNIENAGDLSKGGQYDGLTEETAYRITCIEDLVEWSNNYSKYSSKYILLENTIDFNSTGSYKDYRAKTIDINKNGEVEELITELTTGTGFKPIAGFYGTFDGQENEIRNIYENRTSEAGLFLGGNCTIKNLTLTGNIVSNSHATGFVVRGSSYIEKCVNKINIKGNNIVAGIVGWGGSTVKNCKNYGDLYITGQSYAYTGAGGICSYGASIIEDCINYGSISGNGTIGGIETTGERGIIVGCKNYGKINGNGGILGFHRFGEIKLIDNINYGDIIGEGVKGGIVGRTVGATWTAELNLSIINCSNQGKVHSNNSYAGGIIGYKYTICAKNTTTIKNCFNIGEVTAGNSNNAKAIIAYVGLDNTENYYHELYNVYGAGNLMGTVSTPNYNKGEAISKTLDEMKSQEFVDELNAYVDNYNEEHKNDEDFVKLNIWKYTEGSYPTFE